jgi:hypothetical protein
VTAQCPAPRRRLLVRLWGAAGVVVDPLGGEVLDVGGSVDVHGDLLVDVVVHRDDEA